jgi:hypothetical protein
MTCDRALEDLSRRMDGGQALSSETVEHLSTCADCGNFHETAAEVSRRYKLQLRLGIDRLRQGEGLPPFGLDSKRPSRSLSAKLLIPLAAALLCCCWGMGRTKPAAPAPPPPPGAPMALAEANRPPPSDPALARLRLFDDLAPLSEEEEFLPLRLDQDLLPLRSSRFEVSLPLSLRF